MDTDHDDAIARNLDDVRGRIAGACARSGRAAAAVTMVAVTKTVPAERVRAAWVQGVTEVGENRVQEARDKAPLLADLPLRWHMIGHLQSNKAGQAVDLFQVVQSVDSVEIAMHLSRRVAAQAGPALPVLIEVNIGNEDAKSGFRVAGALHELFLQSVDGILSLHGLDVQGLMTVAPLAVDAEMARPCFRQLRLLREQLQQRWPAHTWRHLSMGMSGDFEAAIEEGATIVRLGRAIFGERP